jgi:hypothetical protein
MCPHVSAYLEALQRAIPHLRSTEYLAVDEMITSMPDNQNERRNPPRRK